MLKPLATALLAAALPCAALADEDSPAFGLAGILSASNKADLEPITLSAGMPLTQAPWELKSGTYYEFEIIGDGEAVVDEVSVRVWDPSPLPELPLRPLSDR